MQDTSGYGLRILLGTLLLEVAFPWAKWTLALGAWSTSHLR
jgi:hypothetical protein